MSAYNNNNDQANSDDEPTDIPEGFEEVTPADTEEVDLESSGLADFTFEEDNDLTFTEEEDTPSDDA